jgi:hypothetical protein
MSTPERRNQFDRPGNAAGVARRNRGQRGLRRATILTVAGAAVVTVIGTSLASQATTHSNSHRSTGTVASSSAAVAAAQQAQANQAAASNNSASASVPSASQSQPVASSGGS